MKNNLTFAIAFTLLVSSISALGQYANLEFVENKGQWPQGVKYSANLTNGALFLQNDGFRVLLRNPDDMKAYAEYFHGHNDGNNTAEKSAAISPGKEKSVIVRSHVYDVKFVNASVPTIVPDKALPTYNNYFLGDDPSKWAGDCKIFQGLTYKNIYPGIDVRYYTSDQKMKYDIIVRPGADISQLKITYDGVEKLSVKNEKLVVQTSVGNVSELEPYTYQLVNGIKKEISCRYKVIGKNLQFNIPEYDKTSTLVIDPTLIFSSFSGSSADNWGYTATYGPDGSFYGGGVVFASGFPVSTGAFQTSFGGGVTEGALQGYDIGIIKFSANGNNRIYATYIGGGGNEQPHSLIVDAQGQLIIGGRTNSTNYPTTAPTFGGGGGYDIIITKLNAAGSALIGSRKIGGTANDGVNVVPKYTNTGGAQSILRNYGDDSRSEVILDNAGNIYIASNSQSTDFPTTPGVFQTAFAGQQDAVIIKTSPDINTILYSTLLGGSGDDAAFVLAINPSNGNLYVGGNTTSSNLPGDKTGTVYPAFQGGVSDGFVSIISPNGNNLLKTSYMGTTGIDMIYGIQFDRFSFPYIMGTSTVSWPIINAPFSQTGGKQFIAKLAPDLSSFQYSTIFGTNSTAPNLSPIAFLVDRCQNVYVSGWGGRANTFNGTFPTSGTSGLTTTNDGLQKTTDGSDFYFFVLEKNATSQLYGTFFGQFDVTGSGAEHVDGGTSRFDPNGVIYQGMCANCGRSAQFPTTPGVWAETNGSSNCNFAGVKIAFNLAGIGNSIRPSIDGVPRKNSGCIPLTVDFRDTIAQGQSYYWNFGDGSPEVRTTTPSISHTYTAVNTYRVRLITIDSASCNIADSAFTNIIVRNDEASLDFNLAKIGTCQSTTYNVVNNSVAPPGKPFTNIAFRWTMGDGTPPQIKGPQPFSHTFPGNGTYIVKMVLVDTNYCNAPDSLSKTIRISPNVTASFTTPPSGCAPYNAVMNNTSAGGQQFTWNFGDGTTSTASSPKHLYTTPGTYTISMVAIDTSTCNLIDSTKFTITVSGSPIAAFNFSPKPPLENTPVLFTNNSIGGILYRWEFGDGDTLLTSFTTPISHTFNETRKYTTCLIVTNSFGCKDTLCDDVEGRVIPLVDVPSAFTPNGDGINDYVYVRGFGISKMIFRIFNRWGTLVYQSADRKQGWDGKYKGQLQPKEVYHYVLDAVFSDGTKYQKKGDITLL